MHTTDQQIVIVGTGGHARSVMAVAQSAGYTVAYFVDEQPKTKTLMGVPIRKDLQAGGEGVNVAIAIGDNFVREKVAGEIRARFPATRFPTLVHADASIAPSAKLGDGAVVMQNATLGANADIGELCIVNTAAVLDHDGVMAPFSSLAPGVVAGGGVRVGHGSAVGIGAVVFHNTAIGAHAVVGAASLVNTNVPDKTLWFGTPARHIKDREPGEPYL